MFLLVVPLSSKMDAVMVMVMSIIKSSIQFKQAVLCLKLQ